MATVNAPPREFCQRTSHQLLLPQRTCIMHDSDTQSAGGVPCAMRPSTRDEGLPLLAFSPQSFECDCTGLVVYSQSLRGFMLYAKLHAFERRCLYSTVEPRNTLSPNEVHASHLSLMALSLVEMNQVAPPAEVKTYFAFISQYGYHARQRLQLSRPNSERRGHRPCHAGWPGALQPTADAGKVLLHRSSLFRGYADIHR